MEENLSFLSLATFILLLLLNITTLASSTTSTDQLALLAFKNTITSDPHGLLTKNWSTATSVCSWIGVTCSINPQRVTSLNVSGFALRGAITPHVGNLTFLQSLDVSFNYFTGIIPSELSNLRRLEEFNAGDNMLTGEIPSWFGALPEVRRMNLTNNNFSGGIPPSLFNISRLQVLEMGNNSLVGDIPDVVGNLSSLQVFNLEYNQLTGSIPKGIFNVSSLIQLNLIHNQLSNNIPGDICNNNPRLKMMVLSINQLSGEIPANIWKCRKLEELALTLNNFSGSIPTEIGSLSMLKYFYLGTNNLEGSIPKQVGNLTSLVELDIRRNNFTGELPVELGVLPFLEFFSVRNNSLSGTIPSSIFNISTLKMLELSFNQIDGTLPSTMGTSLSNLEQLYLYGNKFSGPIPISITNASKLTVLELQMNSFSGSIPNFGGLGRLQVLRIWENNLTGADSTIQEIGFFSSLTNCRYLETLEVSRNPLIGILPAAAIGNLSTSLLRFWARGCNINGVIPPEIGNLSSLIELYLYDNQMTGSIPSTIGKLKNLQGMSLGNNYLQGSIPHDICQMSVLVELNLSANSLTDSIPECFGEVKSLRKIDLGCNKLTSTIPSNLWNLVDLLTLNLSSNYLSGNLSSQIGNLKAIYEMDLSINHFRGDIPSSLGGCQSLATLSLLNNMFNGSIPVSLGSAKGLKSLDLTYNNLSGTIPKSLEQLRFLEYFNVSYNSLDGEIPNGGPFANFTAQSFMRNSDLCGSARFLVPPCMTSHGRSRSRSKLRPKDVARLIVYIVASFIAAIIWVSGVFLSIVFVIIIRRQKDAARTPTRLIGHQTSVGVSWRVISYRELMQATSEFSETNLLGTGGFSSVYKGILPDGLDIAVKVFNLELEGAAESFDTEAEILSSIRHRNLVRMIGCCTNTEFKALILAYMPNGSLERWLYSDTYCMDLEQRLDIALDVALALEYLHHHHTFPVVHCDVKPDNVLLDQDLTAHVADFGIAKLFENGEAVVQSTTLATIGYAAPEYGSEGKVSTKGDVYSYGILLLEMFTRKKPTDDMFNGNIGLKEWISDAVERNAISEVLDPALFLKEENMSPVFDLAMKCLAVSPGERINMIQAASAVQKIKDVIVKNELTLKSSPYYSIADSSPASDHMSFNMENATTF